MASETRLLPSHFIVNCSLCAYFCVLYLHVVYAFITHFGYQPFPSVYLLKPVLKNACVSWNTLTLLQNEELETVKMNCFLADILLHVMITNIKICANLNSLTLTCSWCILKLWQLSHLFKWSQMKSVQTWPYT